MSFKSITDHLFESPEEEVARLAAAPEGSMNRHLSTLPVLNPGWVMDLVIELPRVHGDQAVVVVPFEHRRSIRERKDGKPWRRHDGYWACLVVYSEHPSYPVGGHRLSVSEAELVRGRIRTIAPIKEDS